MFAVEFRLFTMWFTALLILLLSTGTMNANVEMVRVTSQFDSFRHYDFNCTATIDFMELADCVDGSGNADVAIGGTTNKSIVIVECLVDDGLFFFDAFVNDGIWISNFQVQGEIVHYMKAIAGNSETGCTVDYPGPIEVPIESCSGGTPNLLEFALESPEYCAPLSAEITMYEPGSATLKHTYILDFNESEEAYQLPNPPIGIFDVFIKPSGSLQEAYSQLEIQAGIQVLVLQEPMKGDLNNSNSINIVDVSLLSQAFNSSEGDLDYNPSADFDCSAGVNILDVSIFSKSFSLEGVSPPIIEP